MDLWTTLRVPHNPTGPATTEADIWRAMIRGHLHALPTEGFLATGEVCPCGAAFPTGAACQPTGESCSRSIPLPGPLVAARAGRGSITATAGSASPSAASSTATWSPGCCSLRRPRTLVQRCSLPVRYLGFHWNNLSQVNGWRGNLHGGLDSCRGRCGHRGALGARVARGGTRTPAHRLPRPRGGLAGASQGHSARV